MRPRKRQRVGQSSLRQEILSEDEYLSGLSRIIRRDFFPGLVDTQQEADVVDSPALQSDFNCVTAPICTRARRDSSRSATDGPTPRDISAATPTAGSTSVRARYHDLSNGSARRPAADQARLSLNSYQARYTSEDNSAFATLLDEDNQARSRKHRWAIEAEKTATQRMLEARASREDLVANVQRQFEAEGVVRLLEGTASKPGHRVLDSNRPPAEKRLLTYTSSAPTSVSQTTTQHASREPRAPSQQFIDWDDTLADVKAEFAEKQADAADTPGTRDEAWSFKARNALMFDPEQDPRSKSGHQRPDSDTINYAAFQDQMPHDGSKNNRSEACDSPTSSRISRAVGAKPVGGETPRVGGFSFVDALPETQARNIPSQGLADLMTWGSIESTPLRQRPSNDEGSTADEAPGPFRIKEPSKREALAHKLTSKARRALSKADPTPRRIAQLSATPRSQHKTTDLSPAARSLLERTSSKSDAKSTPRPADKSGTSSLQSARRDSLRRQRWTPSPAPREI